MMIRNPIYAFGCWANGGHVWSKKYQLPNGWAHACLWCDLIEETRPPKRTRKAARQ